LLKKFASIWKKDMKIIENSNYNIDKSLVCTRDDFKYKNSRPTYQNMLIEAKEWMDLHPSYYSHY
jgi:hypothetical protein